MLKSAQSPPATTTREAPYGRRFGVIDPATGHEVVSAAEGDKADVERAVVAARLAFENPAWREMKPAIRQRLMHRLADLMEQHVEATWPSRDAGRALEECSVGVTRLLRYARNDDGRCKARDDSGVPARYFNR